MACVMLASTVQAQPVAAPEAQPVAAPGPPIVKGDWTFPDWKQAQAYYPQAALNAKVQGRATIDCEVEPHGRLTSCVVVSETPEGYGFGAAAAALFIRYAFVEPASVEGGIQPGSHKIMSINFVV